MSSVNLGIIGCGKVVSYIHLNALRRVPQARVIAVADPVEERRRQVAERCGGAAGFADWQELLERSDVQAVLICTPSGDHAECAMRAFARRKHVYLEKPIATTPEEGRSVLTAWEGTSLLGMMGFNYRQHPLFVRAREMVKSGELGKIVGVQSVFTSSGAWLQDWKKNRVSAGGVLLDLGTHHIDLTHFVLGQPVSEVSARVASEHSEQDTAWLRMTLQEGAVVQSFFSLHGTDANRFEIYGESARLTVDYLARTLQIVRRGQVKFFHRVVGGLGREVSRLKSVLARGRDPSYAIALSAFVKAIAEGASRIEPDLTDGLRASLIVDAAERSAATGQSQRVEALPIR